MWPWEHLAFGYVLLSATLHVARDRSPGGVEAGAVVLATQFPDLVDKPLSWGFGLFPSGYAIGHSLLLAVPLSAAVAGLARRRGWPGAGVAFVVGYASHLAGDVLSPFLSGGPLAFERLLWPVATFAPYETSRGFVGRFTLYVGRYAAEAAEPSNLPYLAAYVAVFLGVAFLWLTDGAPGVHGAVAALRTSRRER